ncbi:hypothetical protein D3C81_519820 [compost metagenome]
MACNDQLIYKLILSSQEEWVKFGQTYIAYIMSFPLDHNFDTSAEIIEQYNLDSFKTMNLDELQDKLKEIIILTTELNDAPKASGVMKYLLEMKHESEEERA